MEKEKSRWDIYKTIAFGGIMMVIVLYFLFISSFPTFDEYCNQGKLAIFKINIWKGNDCTQYFNIEYKKYNTSIYIIPLNEIKVKNLTKNQLNETACGLFMPPNLIIINENRSKCFSINETLSHELRHLKCFRKGYGWHNETESHSGCFLNITI